VHYNTDAIVRNTRRCFPPPRYFILDTHEQSFYRRTELPVPLIKERRATYRSPKSDRTARDKLPSREQNDKSPELARNILQGRRDLAAESADVARHLVIIYSIIVTVNQAWRRFRSRILDLCGILVKSSDGQVMVQQLRSLDGSCVCHRHVGSAFT